VTVKVEEEREKGKTGKKYGLNSEFGPQGISAGERWLALANGRSPKT
jgi:hypothetical protein